MLNCLYARVYELIKEEVRGSEVFELWSGNYENADFFKREEESREFSQKKEIFKEDKMQEGVEGRSEKMSF